MKAIPIDAYEAAIRLHDHVRRCPDWARLEDNRIATRYDTSREFYSTIHMIWQDAGLDTSPELLAGYVVALYALLGPHNGTVLLQRICGDGSCDPIPVLAAKDGDPLFTSELFSGVERHVGGLLPE